MLRSSLTTYSTRAQSVREEFLLPILRVHGMFAEAHEREVARFLQARGFRVDLLRASGSLPRCCLLRPAGARPRRASFPHRRGLPAASRGTVALEETR